MAPAAFTQQPNGAVAPTSKKPITKRVTSQLHGVNRKSRLEMPKPLTDKARCDITRKTEELMKMRNKLDQVLHKEAKRGQKDLKLGSCPRADVLKLSDALARREAKHFRARSRWIEERKRLYKWDPSIERKIDLDLLQALQWKFQRNLSTRLSDRGRPLQLDEADSDNSSNGKDGSNNEDVLARTMPQSNADLVSSSKQADSVKNSPMGASRQTASGLDGAFDDYAKERPRKQKVVDRPGNVKAEEERLAQAKKERATDNSQTTTQRTKSIQHNVSKSDFEDEEAAYISDLAAIDRMAQPEKKPKVCGKKAHIKTEESVANSTTATSTSSENASLAKTRGAQPKATTPPIQASDVKKSGTQKEPLLEPWYKFHARAMMAPDFNDMVYYRPTKKRKRPFHDVIVHGAINEPHDVASGELSLPTPPISSPEPSTSTQSESEKAHKTQRANPRKKKTRYGKARNH